MTRTHSPITQTFLRHTGATLPVICGAMYPCSNPELVAAVSAGGGIGMIQPLSMVFVHKHPFAEGLRLIRSITSAPVGLNIIVEKSVQVYEARMREYLRQALDGGVRFFVTALGNPRWVVEEVHAAKGFVYHDVTERRWAERALREGVDGLIAVNRRAGGHAGTLDPEPLLASLRDLGVPVVCAGGIGDGRAVREALEMGYAGVQMGTRFIATHECRAHDDYKNAIVKARASDIVLTEKLSGVPVAVIRTPYVEQIGTRAGWLGRKLLRGHRTKHWMRLFYSLRSVWHLKNSLQRGHHYRDYLQAGQSVESIAAVQSVADVLKEIRSQID